MPTKIDEDFLFYRQSVDNSSGSGDDHNRKWSAIRRSSAKSSERRARMERKGKCSAAVCAQTEGAKHVPWPL